ncbi:MAG TPA: hypothetical protein VF786_05825, partial [Terriglobales bacterium]
EAAKKAFDPANHVGWMLLHQVAPVFGFTSFVGGLIGLWFGRSPAELSHDAGFRPKTPGSTAAP